MSRYSIREVQQWGQTYIDRAEVDILIAHVLKVKKEFSITHPEYKISKLKYYKIKHLISKRTKGIPIAYLTGHKEFFGLDFLVNKHTLIPRPETELMVEAVRKMFPPLLGEGQGRVESKKNIILIDAGTGSGCIPISILKSFNLQSSILTYGIDISKKALKIANKNAKKHNVDIALLHGNLLEPIIKTSSLPLVPCSLIITANLPYLTQEQFNGESSIQHEPITALVTDDGGLFLYKKLLEQIKELLTTYHLPLTTFFEIDPSQTKQLSNHIQNIFPKAQMSVHKDGMGNDRMVKIHITH